MKNVIIIFLILFTNYSYAQTYLLSGEIVNEKRSALANVTIEANGTKATSDKNGKYEIRLPKGTYTINFSHIAYKTFKQKITINNNSILDIVFSSNLQNIDEVYVTAQESKNLTTSSVITKDAMQLLQPSSFADVLELLPGGRAQDPNLTDFNAIKLREVNLKGKTITSDKFDMSSLGIAFYIDGAPINTNADLQSLSNYSTSTNNSDRTNTNKGLDLRSLGTDDIEKITIIRGIPSVEYGDLTSGLVLIDRKKGFSKYNIRAKTDGFGKLFSLSKGYSLPNNWLINYDIGFIRATSNPTNSFENFNRGTLSFRLDKTWKGVNTYNWQSNWDYNTTLDNKKTDPDNSYILDKYYSRNQRYALNNIFSINFDQKSWIDKLEFTSSLSYKKDIVDEDKWIQARTATILVNSLEEGSHEAQFLTPSYLSSIYIEGLPLSIFNKLISKHNFNFNRVQNNLKFGIESNFYKNYGKGQVYDLDFPAIANSEVTARPRAFKDIPASHTLSAFAENDFNWNIQNFRLNAVVGIRAFSMTSLSKDYTMSNKVYAEPRTNLRLHLPQISVDNKPFLITVGGGFGILKKTPTMDQLYPNLEYRDIVELNFYHNNPEFRVAQAYTHISNPTNHNLKPATNIKFEANTDLEFDKNTLSITLFKETMRDAFRFNSLSETIAYRLYDNTSIDASSLTEKPSASDFKYTDRKERYNNSFVENGSEILKSGLEFQLMTKRFESIKTRFTAVGAYYKTTYKNSLPIWKTDRNIVHNGLNRQVSAKYIDDDGYIRNMLNTNLTADTYIKSLGMNFMASFQALWFTVSQSTRKSGVPIAYKFVDDNIEKPFTEESLNDPTLKQLVEPYSENNFRRFREPLDFQINLKASKSFKDFIKASVFVNRLFLYRPTYTNALGGTTRRELDAPYFGMEITLSL